ncbi:MAG: prepilin-type N-terminal cleavage/methylation domain-containing protein, partial [Deltaproteobacteria bacterium]|nr:prepilin-type N-terminal cleavage/methylation domain-containing protein [Deltaproteobacteria bacterium]
MLSSKRAGFSLIEVMVAMVILTLGLFAVINLQVIAVRGNTFARARTDAQKIA